MSVTMVRNCQENKKLHSKLNGSNNHFGYGSGKWKLKFLSFYERTIWFLLHSEKQLALSLIERMLSIKRLYMSGAWASFWKTFFLHTLELRYWKLNLTHFFAVSCWIWKWRNSSEKCLILWSTRSRLNALSLFHHTRRRLSKERVKLNNRERHF